MSIIHITMSLSIILLFSEEGSVLVWGDNKHGQCVKVMSPMTILYGEMFGGQKVTGIYSGWTHLLASTG